MGYISVLAVGHDPAAVLRKYRHVGFDYAFFLGDYSSGWDLHMTELITRTYRRKECGKTSYLTEVIDPFVCPYCGNDSIDMWPVCSASRVALCDFPAGCGLAENRAGAGRMSDFAFEDVRYRAVEERLEQLSKIRVATEGIEPPDPSDYTCEPLGAGGGYSLHPWVHTVRVDLKIYVPDPVSTFAAHLYGQEQEDEVVRIARKCAVSVSAVATDSNWRERAEIRHRGPEPEHPWYDIFNGFMKEIDADENLALFLCHR